MKRKLFSIFISLALVLSMMPMTVLAENERTVKLEFGEGHEDFVKNTFVSEYHITGQGAYPEIIFYKPEEGASFVNVNLDRTYAGHACLAMMDALYQIVGENKMDGDFRLTGNIGIKPSYDSWDEYNQDYYELYNVPFENIDTYYALWEKPAKLDLTFTPPQCRTTVTVEGSGAETHTVPFPEVTATGVDCSPNQGGGWYTGEDFTSFFSGAFEGGNDCYAAFHARAKFGYYITEDAFNNATISGATIVSKEYMGGLPYFKVKSTVVHFEHDPVIVDPTCTDPGSKTYTCQNCDKEIKESIDALGHDWGKWTKLNDEQHQRVCANDSSHIDKADHNWKDEGTTYTCSDCGATKEKETPKPKPTPKPAPAKISGTLLAKMTAKGKTKLELSWTKVNGAEGYDVFFNKCGKEYTCKRIKTIKGNKTFKWTAKGLKKWKSYKAVVKAWVMKDGKKTYVRTGPMVHAYTSGGTRSYTNAKSVTVDKDSVSLKTGKTYKIKAGVTKLKKGKKLMPTDHAPRLRYISNNKKVATVSNDGKITAKGKGSCKVYTVAANGVRKAVSVTVK